MVNVLERNNVQIKGKGERVLLFAHGFGCDQQMWRFIEEYFLNNFKCIFFDYVGSGKSDISAYDNIKYNTLDGYVKDLLEIVHELQLEKCIIIGHSISSMVGLLAAIEEPEKFEKVIMIGPSPCYLNDTDYVGGFNKVDIEELLTMMEMNFLAWSSYMAPLVMDGTNPTHLQHIENSFVSTNPKVARQFAEVTFYSDCRSQLEKLLVSTLILQCSDDSIVPIHVGDYLHQHIPNSELVLLQSKGHYPHISQPKETAEAMLQFIG